MYGRCGVRRRAWRIAWWPAFLELRQASLPRGETLLRVVIGARCAFSWLDILAEVWAVRRSETGVAPSVPNKVDAEYVEKLYGANLVTKMPRVTNLILSCN